jgi:rubrerythrin
MATDTHQTIKLLSDLIHLDVDAQYAYAQALDSVTHVEIREQFIRFRDDHARHVEALAAQIEALGGVAPRRTRDMKGFLLEGFTAIRSATGDEGALKAMKLNEQLTNRRYERAAKVAVEGAVAALIERHREDENLHLEYIEKALRDRLWEAPAAPPPM